MVAGALGALTGGGGGTQLGSAYGQIILDASGVQRGANQAQGILGGLETGMANVGSALTKRVTLPLLGVGAAATNVAGDFESQMATLSVAARSSGTSLETLRDAALRTGADTSLVGISAAQSAEALEGLYKAGLTTEEIFGDLNDYMEDTAELSGVLRGSVDLQAASSLNLAQASDSVAVAMATFGLEADQATDVVDNFIQTADASVTEVDELVDALANVGPTAAAFGWTLEDTNTALAILSERGIRGAEAGTALRSMMTNLMRPVDDVKETLAELNVSLYDASGAMLSLPEILSQLETSLAGVTEEQRNMHIQQLAGTYGMKAMQTLLADGTEGWQAMEGAIASAATASEVAAARTDTFQGAMEALGGTVETALIEVGTPLINDFIRPTVEGLSELIQMFLDLPAPIRDTAVQVGLLAAGLGPLLKVGSSLVGTYATLYRGLKAFPGLISQLGGVSASTALQVGALGVALVGLTVALQEYGQQVEETRDASQRTSDVIAGLSDSVEDPQSALALMDQRMRDLEESTGGVASGVLLLGDALWGTGSRTELISQGLDEVQDAALRTTDTYEEYLAFIDRWNGMQDNQLLKLQAVDKAQWSHSQMTGTLTEQYRQQAPAISGVSDEAHRLAQMYVELEGSEARALEAAGDLTDGWMASQEASLEAGHSYMVAQRRLQEWSEEAHAVRPLAVDTADAVGNIARNMVEFAEATEEASEAQRDAEFERGKEIFEQWGETLELAGIEAGILETQTNLLGDTLGLTSETARQSQADLQLVMSAYAEGSLSVEAFVGYMQQAQAGTLNLSEAQIRGITAARDHAQATREAAAAADEYRLMLLSESEALKDAGAQQAAQIALRRLQTDYEDGRLSLDDYEAAVISVQDAYELATPQSRALAGAIQELNDGLVEGRYAPEDYAAAVDAAKQAADDGADSVGDIMEAVQNAVGPFSEGEQAIAGLGSSASTAAGQVDALKGATDRAKEALENVTSKEWVVKVGTAGSWDIPQGAEPIAAQEGIWRVPGIMTALLHPEEMVVPAAEAELLRGLMTAPPPVQPAPAMVERTFGPARAEEPITVNFYDTVVNDQMDIEVLAYQVADRIQRRR